ncbi:MAG TPA: HEAT repeat domain-containing protein, partial [Planctomycetes bacterium]|nr:HEAT repeat domain-containing protein [Planctomycetota bacterium]
MSNRPRVFRVLELLILVAVVAGCQGGGAKMEPAREKDQTLEFGRQLLSKLEESRTYDSRLIDRMISHPRVELRQEAVLTVGRLRDERGVEAVAGRLLDRGEPPEVRASAAFALGLIGTLSSLEALVAGLDDPEASVREEASRALGRISGEGSGIRAVEALVAALGDPDATVRGAAALACWHLGKEARAATGPLVAILSDEGELDEVRWRTAYALMRIADPDSTPSLRKGLSDRDGLVRTYSAWGLRNLEDSQAVVPLGALLADPSSPWTARVEALRTIGALREGGRCDLVASRDILLEHLIREKHPLAQQTLVEALASGA